MLPTQISDIKIDRWKNGRSIRQNAANLQDFKEYPAPTGEIQDLLVFRIYFYLLSLLEMFVCHYHIHSFQKLKNRKSIYCCWGVVSPWAAKQKQKTKHKCRPGAPKWTGLAKKVSWRAGCRWYPVGLVISARGMVADPVKSAKEGIVVGYPIVKADSLA